MKQISFIFFRGGTCAKPAANGKFTANEIEKFIIRQFVCAAVSHVGMRTHCACRIFSRAIH